MRSFEQIVAESFKIPVEEVHDSLTMKDVPDWDSMNYLLFISEVEKEFDISFTMDEVLTADSLGAIRKIVRNRGKQI